MTAALSLKQARAVYVGERVRKQFPEGLFNGAVRQVHASVWDKEEKKKWPQLYNVLYEDGDDEDITLEELQAILVDPQNVARKVEEFLSASAAAAAAAAGSGGGEQPPHGASGDENDENGARRQQAQQPQRKRQRVAGVLGDATGRSGNAAPGDERRSRRESKRRVDDDFQYEDPRSAKRAAAEAGGAGGRQRFGIRAPSQAAALAAAPLSSESNEPCPTGAAGMRLAQLPGHLQKIEVVNFMCHEHFTMEFGHHVTFVSGTNGSGKSAVLQALQCCLGVKASDTGRANSFKKLIRTGADEAIIRVTVSNRPYKNFDGFRHSVFGDAVVVERRLQRAGTSSYALKDAAGRVHGRKRDDLDAMLQTLGLNAANPVCVMTQDTARNFLAGSSNKADQERFQLYMDATQLSQIAYNLELSRGQVRLMDESVQKIREDYEAMRAEHEALQKSIAALQGIEAWRQETLGLEKVLNWAVVDEAGAGERQLVSALEGEIPRRLAAAEQQLEELRREEAALRQATESKAHFLETYHNRASALAAELEALKQRGKEAHRAMRAAEAKIKQLGDALAEEQAHKETLEHAVREVADDALQATQAVVGRYQRELEAAQAADDAARQEVDGLAAAYQEAAKATKAAHERQEAVRGELYAIDAQIGACQEDIRRIREAGRSKAAAFGGAPVQRLVAAIGKTRGFSRPPIGPVGQHLVLEDARWGLAVEAALGFHLDAFLVHNMADSHTLRGLINQHCGGARFKPSVYVVNFDLPQHTIPASNQPPPALPTVYRLLRVADRRLAAPIMNNLVDQAHIERIAVGASNNECIQSGWHTSNVMACYGVDGAKYYTRGATQTSTRPPHWLRVARLGQSAAQQTTELEADVERLQRERQLKEQEYARAQRETQAADAAETERRKAMTKKKQDQWGTQQALTQLTQAPPPELTAATPAEGDDGVQAEILQATQVCIDLEQQLRECQGRVEEARGAAEAAVAAVREKSAESARLQESNEQFLQTYHGEVQQLAQVEGEREAKEVYCGEVRASAAQLRARLEQQRQELAYMTEEAAKICSREEGAAARAEAEARLRAKKDLSDGQIAMLLTADLLDKKIRQLEKKIGEHERAAGGSLDELQIKFEASRARMRSDGRRFKQAIQTYQVVEDALKLRVHKLRELDHQLEGVVNARFRQYMWRKGHTGQVKLDRKNRTLQLKVQVNSKGGGGREGGAKEAAVKDLKQLSGGERSYTTVAFTLALGGQTEMPFRCMDEFDVFMDAVNRRVAMQNLFGFAKENPELQFVFLTPQDMAAVDDARRACQAAGQEIPEGFVRIVQMRAARANATRA